MITLDELVTTLRECAGVDEEELLEGDILDVPFEDLGYDSLAMLNTLGRLEREHQVSLPDDVIDKCPTPRALLDEINSRIGSQA